MPLDTRQQKWLPLGLNPQACVQDTATESSRPGIPFPDHRFRYLQPPFQALLSSYDQQSCGKQVSSCLNGRRSSCDAAASPEGALKSSRKRFLVFDQSGNQTRLLQCGFPLQFPPSMDAEQGRILDSLNQEKGFSKGNAIPDKMLLRDDHVNGEEEEEEESEMHEDTEEINALLYSDDEDNDDCESDDDVMSTGHSPFQQACNNTTREELDETESSDDGPRRKRQKLLDQSYKDQSPSLVGTITKLKGLSDEKLHDTNISSNKQQETGSVLSEEQSRKDKIHTALRILESVVPGAKGKEALLLLDEAIDYLKLLKRNLNSSKEGLNYNHW